jgi:hypothetical protein
MSFGVQGTLASILSNLSHLKKHELNRVRTSFKDIKEAHQNHADIKLKFKEISPMELKIIREMIRADLRKLRKRPNLILVLSLAFAISLLVFLYWVLNNWLLNRDAQKLFYR